ncbi:MAG: SGNH/GDSL hydrolase family protein [Rariglobus sp.]
MRFPFLLTVLFSAGLSMLHAADSVAEKPVTIMPLGDSITEGDASFSVYRYPLMEKLRAAGYDVVYVGSKTTQPRKDSPLGVLAHEGHSGKNAAFIRAQFERVYRQHRADIVLIHAGHNQFSDQKPVPQLLADMRGIIATARIINPKVIILLGQVIPSGKLPKYDYIPEFNAALIPLAAELHSSDQPVIVVDHASGFDWQTDTIADRVHPNANGAEKMATRWFASLQTVLPTP